MQVKKSVALLLTVGLAGCVSLPSSGPTGHQIEKTAAAPEQGAPINVVEVRTITDVPSLATAALSVPALPVIAPPPTDMVGPGDVLDINIYEAGVTLFASAAAAGPAGQVSASPGVQVQKLPPSRVDDQGNITIPYAGKIRVVGMTTREIEQRIQNSLRKISQNPQVLVTLTQAITNSVIVGGEVSRPGRLVLQTNRETLSDVIALAGGYRGEAKDLTLRITRGSVSADIRINELILNRDLDVPAYPGDRFMIVTSPRTYSILGASGRVQQVPFSRPTVSLAEAVATAGGANPGSGDPAAIFVFRFTKGENQTEIPVVYHLNMMNAGSYFVAQKFFMQDQDVVYFGDSAANRPSKLIQLISQLFSPILTVTSTVQTVQNSSR